MVIRGHMIEVSVYSISQAVVADIRHNKKVCTAMDSLKYPFASPLPKRGQLQLQIAVSLIIQIKRGTCDIVDGILSERDNIVVNLFVLILYSCPSPQVLMVQQVMFFPNCSMFGMIFSYVYKY